MFLALGIVILLFILSYYIIALWIVALIVLGIWIALVLIDYAILFFMRHNISVSREVDDKLSNGDENVVTLKITETGRVRTFAHIIDELPVQFQNRNFLIKTILEPGITKAIKYQVRPTDRGQFSFGEVWIYTHSQIGFVERKHIFPLEKIVKVYPSFLHIKSSVLKSMSFDESQGESKLPKIASSMEFDHIREYVIGDDIRNINWKATARRQNLMINDFIDERKQNIYLLIDKGRTMYYPFENMTLQDYAINSALMLSYAVLYKKDKVGLVTFNNKLDLLLPPSNTKRQLNKITEGLYAQHSTFQETDYEVLLNTIKNKIGQRSFLLLYTNIETIISLRRHLPYLSSIAKKHLLCVVVFKNEELEKKIDSQAANVSGIYKNTIAQKFIYEKKLIIRELNNKGIQTIYTTPQNLSIDALNKYLELKRKRLI
jgi:uncharacterized protein (DUF58 family)